MAIIVKKHNAMKKIYFLFIFLVSQIIHSKSQSYELGGISGKDTINKSDALGKKQGKWVIKGKHKPGSCFSEEQKAEEGKYNDNKKIGKWLEYYCNGNLKNQLTFQNGRPDGYAIMYHENGKISEEGNWKNNRWTGPYKLYYENGQPQHEFNFNASGKREGPVKYYYEDGQIAIEGTFVNGKEAGVIKEFHPNGDLKAEKTFNDGAVDVASIKEYEPKKPIIKVVEKIEGPKAIVNADENVNGGGSKNRGALVLNGQNTTYNKNKQITKDGFFKDNRLMDGKQYIYDANGILQRITVYKNGNYVGDAPVEN
jgi:antitoxin component YwqK of YwqJK toxin-antitoxin module